MSDSQDSDESLMQEETWDLKAARAHKPRTTRRVVISVSMSSDDLNLVAKAAERMQLKVSEFIREAAIEKAKVSQMYLLLASATFSLGQSAFIEPSVQTQVMALSSAPILVEA